MQNMDRGNLGMDNTMMTTGGKEVQVSKGSFVALMVVTMLAIILLSGYTVYKLALAYDVVLTGGLIMSTIIVLLGFLFGRYVTGKSGLMGFLVAPTIALTISYIAQTNADGLAHGVQIGNIVWIIVFSLALMLGSPSGDNNTE